MRKPSKKQHAYAPSDWVFKGNYFAGTTWNVNGSSNNIYSVELTEQGFTCDCTGFVFHGKCKHTKQVADRFDEYS